MAHIAKNQETGAFYLADDWHIADVLNIREDLTEIEALGVLEFLADNFDANEGINWGVIEAAADYLYPTGRD